MQNGRIHWRRRTAAPFSPALTALTGPRVLPQPATAALVVDLLKDEFRLKSTLVLVFSWATLFHVQGIGDALAVVARAFWSLLGC